MLQVTFSAENVVNLETDSFWSKQVEPFKHIPLGKSMSLALDNLDVDMVYKVASVDVRAK